MFTWICPQCGREVPPSYDACPDCKAKEKSGQLPAEPAPQAPPPGLDGAPAVATAMPPAPPVYTPPAVAPLAAAQYAPPPPRAGMPTWVLAILFAFAFVGLGAGVYWAINYFPRRDAGGFHAAVETSGGEDADQTESPTESTWKSSGIRFVENAQHRTEARFVVVNHSDADITDLAGTVNIWGRTAKSEEEAAGSFSFKMASLKPNESQEAVAPLSTKLKVYELPDWQNVSTEVQITAP
jgi:hypothetical protein